MHTISSPASLRLRLRGGVILVVAEVSPGRSVAWWRTRDGRVVRRVLSAMC